MFIKEKILQIRKEIPSHVRIVAAAKTRSVPEVEEAIEAGITDIGHNYVQEAEKMAAALPSKAACVTWHMIGEIQTNKINKALNIFNMIQTIDSIEKAEAIDRRAERVGRATLSGLIEVNIAKESAKSGAAPEFENIKAIAERISILKHIELKGLMTMGPVVDDPQKLRPHFRTVKNIFDRLKSLTIENVEMNILSMGMSDSYQVAIEEGANMIRLGTVLFGERHYAR